MSLVALRMHFVAGILDRAGAHPAPDQHNVFGRRVVEAVPAAARRIDHVAFARRLVAMIGVDHALALSTMKNSSARECRRGCAPPSVPQNMTVPAPNFASPAPQHI